MTEFWVEWNTNLLWVFQRRCWKKCLFQISLKICVHFEFRINVLSIWERSKIYQTLLFYIFVMLEDWKKRRGLSWLTKIRYSLRIKDLINKFIPRRFLCSEKDNWSSMNNFERVSSPYDNSTWHFSPWHPHNGQISKKPSVILFE